MNITYSNKDIIYEIGQYNGLPKYKDIDDQLYVLGDSGATRVYIVNDWQSIYITNLTENTAVVNYPLFYFREGAYGVEMYKNTISKLDGVWLLDNRLEADLIELDEISKKKLGFRSVVIDMLYINDNIQLYKFIENEGESIEIDGVKYTNIGYFNSSQFEPYTSKNLLYYCENYTKDIYDELNTTYFKEIDGKLYVKNIDDIRKKFNRFYQLDTLEILDFNDEEASIKINYLNYDKQVITINFKIYHNTEVFRIWISDTIL